MNTLFLKVNEQEEEIIKSNNITIKNSEYTNYKNIVCIKPWGYEFLVYESNKIAIWFLKIVKDVI